MRVGRVTSKVGVAGQLLADFGSHASIRQFACETVPQRMKAQSANVSARRAGAFTRYARINAGATMTFLNVADRPLFPCRSWPTAGAAWAPGLRRRVAAAR